MISDLNAVQGTPSYNPAANLAAKGSVDVIDVRITEIYFNSPVFY
jgi:hypothetical protein